MPRVQIILYQIKKEKNYYNIVKESNLQTMTKLHNGIDAS